MSRQYTVYLVDAFTTKKYSGNPAGVVLHEGDLSEKEMQKIAREINVSETAFVESLDKEEFQVRFFTPVEEVDLCGHATIATFYTLGSKGYIHGINKGVKTIYQHTKAGKLAVRLRYHKGSLQDVTMEQSPGEDFGPVENMELLAEAMGISVEYLGFPQGNIPPRKVSTGLKDMMVPVKSRKVLSSITLNKEAAISLSKKEDALSIHAFVQDGTHWYQRNFCPILGIDEEAATGTSTGAMLHYLLTQGVLKNPEVRARQGLEMNRPSDILAMEEKGTIYVGGKAAVVIEGVIHV